ncbi:hypothetical protein LJB82_02925 [Desulfovibrio sp. OttesenSCG-928-M16]|nr:hypothetical protein [Desulfovibrio sp. OttesenSCG-928-M16]
MTKTPSSSKSAKGLTHKAGHDPRAAALSVLVDVVHGKSDSQAALNRALKREVFAIAPSDKGLSTELVYGTLRQYLRLEHFALSFLSRPDKLPDEMRLLLLQTLYEMAFLRVPHHAGVNWAVGHVRNRFGKGLASVANGVLRSMQRSLRDFLYDGAEQENRADAPTLALRYGAPLWLVQLWLEAYGAAQCDMLLRAILGPAPSGLRLNRSRPDWEKQRLALLGEAATAETAAPLAVGPAGLAFTGPLPWNAKELLRRGAAARQSMAAYEALESLLPSAWPLPIWDCCAGRGGKSLPLLEQGLALALASDISAPRLRGFADEYARLELADPPLPALCLADAADLEARPAPLDGGTAPVSLPEQFGTVLIDAPCSGLGTLARRPEIKLRRSPEDLDNLAGLQARILENVWRKVIPGGCALYLTCTLNPAENQGQIARFLAEHPEALLRVEYQTPFDSPLREFFYAARLDKMA